MPCCSHVSFFGIGRPKRQLLRLDVPQAESCAQNKATRRREGRALQEGIVKRAPQALPETNLEPLATSRGLRFGAVGLIELKGLLEDFDHSEALRFGDVHYLRLP